MSFGWIATVLTVLLLGLMGSGIWISIALLGTSYISFELWTQSPVGNIMATSIWGGSASWVLTALPLFIWMGEILFRTRLSEYMFTGLAPWCRRIPGRLLHVNVGASAIFAAASGSSVAACATIGQMSIPELRRQGYDEDMSFGTLAGASTLAIMIPPSIPLIIYGALAELSVGRLFTAGILPGLMYAAILMLYVAAWALLHPERIPPPGPPMSLRERLYASRRLIPILLLVAGVLGSMFFGIATATEAAAVGVVGALILSAITRTLTWPSFWDGLRGATRTTCVIGIIIAACTFLNVMLSFTRAPQELAAWVQGLNLSPYVLIAAITVFFLILGCLVDNIPMIAIGASLILPLVQKAGFDPIWFGIYLVAVCEIGLITPPVGLNLFVLQRMTGKDLIYVARVALPFFFLLLLGIAILVVFPEIATFLPSRMTM